MTFAQPIAFAALALLPLAVAATVLRLRRARAKSRLLAGSPRLRAALLPARSSARLWTRLIFRSLALILLTSALARPQWGGEMVTRTAEGRDIVLAIDTSRSMLARDVPPDRLEFAKLAAMDFVRSLPPGDRVALIAFAGSAFTLAPLTDDRLAIEETILALDTNIIPLGGTRIAAAIDNALSEFNDDSGRRRALIVLTDGEDLEGDLVESARKMRDSRLVLLALGIGSERGDLLPLPEGGFILDENNRPVLSKRDMNGLAVLAREAGGAAFAFEPGQSLSTIAAETLEPLDRFLEQTKSTDSTAAERYHWFLIPAVFFMLLAMWHRPRLRRPEQFEATAPAASAIAVFALAVLLSSPPRSQGQEPETGQPATDAVAEALAVGLADDTRLILRPDRGGIATGAYNLGTRLYDYGRDRLPPDMTLENAPPADIIRDVLADWRDALAHLEYALVTKPKFDEASRNADIVRDAIAELEKFLEQQQQQEQEQQQEQQEQQQQDQQQSQDQQQEQQDSSEGDGQQQDQQPKDGQQDEGGPQEQQQNSEGGEQQEESQSGQQPEPGENEGEGQSQQEPQDQGQSQEGDPSDKRPDAGQDASTGDFKPQTAQAVSGRNLRQDANGNWILPEDPRERAEILEDIRRTLEQRANEDKNVRMLPAADPRQRPRRNW